MQTDPKHDREINLLSAILIKIFVEEIAAIRINRRITEIQV